MAPALVAALLMGGMQVASGFSQKSKGKKAAEANTRPKLGNQAVDDYSDLLGLYEQQAQYGIDPSSLNFMAGKNQDALQSTLQSMLLAGGSPNAVGNAYRGFTESLSDLGVMESEKRWDKIKTLAPMTEQLVSAKLQKFLYDFDAPYKDKAQAASAAMNAGQQQMMAGFDTIGGSIIKSLSNPYPDDKPPMPPPTARSESVPTVEATTGNIPNPNQLGLLNQSSRPDTSGFDFNSYRSMPDTSGFNFGFSNPYPQLTNWLQQQSQQRQNPQMPLVPYRRN